MAAKRPRKPVRKAWEVRDSTIQGRGVFAHTAISKGTRILEYTGERISADEGAARYDDESADTSHVVLFAVDDDTVIDGGRGGSDARFVNHACEPCCEALEDGGRIFIEALRDIAPGEELTYDYRLQFPGRQTAKAKARYPCRCGAATCRGTLLEPRGRRRPTC